MKRRFLAMLLSLAMVLTMLPVAAFAAATELAFTATTTTESDNSKTLKLAFADEDIANGTVWYKALTESDLEADLKAPETLTDSTSSNTGYTKVESNSISNWTTSNTHVAVAFVPTQIDGSNNTAGTVTMWGTALIDAAPALADVTATVPAETEAEAEGNVTISGTASGAVVYYKLGTTAAPITEDDRPVKDAVADSSELDYTEYDSTNPFKAAAGLTLAVAVVNDASEKKILSWTFVTIEKETAENQLGELTVEVGSDNKIKVTKGATAVTKNLEYYTVESSKKGDFDTAKASWTTETALSAATGLGTALSITDATITSSEDGKHIVAVETDGDNTAPKLVAVGITKSTVTYTPATTNTVKLYEGTDGTKDLLDGVTPDQTSGKYAVSVAKATESVKVVTTTATGATVAVTAVKGTDTSVTVTDGDGYKTVPVGAGETVTITVAFTGTDAKTYTIEVTRPTEDSPTVALYEGTNTTGTNLLAGKTPESNTYTVEVANTVEKVTVVATAGQNNGAVTAVGPNGSAATVTDNTVELAVGKTVITVTFTDPAATYTIDVTRAEATPTVALYAGNKAEGDDLLTGKTPDASNKYTVEVENAVANVTVGKTAATDVTGKVTATGPDGNAVTFTGDTVPLAVGKTTIKVEFNDSATTVYTIEVTRKQEAKSITVKDDATPTANELITFDEATTEYTVMVKDDVSKVTIAANLDAAIAGESGTTVTVNGGVGEVSKDAGKVSTVKVTFGTGEEAKTYTIKLVWPSDSADQIEETDMQVDASASVNTTDPTTATLDLTSKVDDVLVAINNTKVVNESNSTTEPVVIQATVADANKKDATEVTLPVAVSDALQETGVAASIETNVGTVTLPSDAIKQVQDDEPEPLKVVIKDESSSIPPTNDKEVARFDVSVMKGSSSTPTEITGLNDNPITLVFAVLTSKIADKVDPVLAWVDDTKVDGTEYKKLKDCKITEDDPNTIFTALTTHLSEFAVVATADLTEDEPAGTIAIAVEDADGNAIALDPEFAVNKTEYTVTTDKTSVTLKVTGVEASTVKVDGANYTTGGVTVDLSNVPTDGKKVSVVYTPATGSATTYEITFKKPETPVDQPLNVKVTDADGNPIDLDPTFDPAVGLYNVEASVSTVKIFVTGGAAGKTNVVRVNNVDTPADPNGVTVNLNDIQTEDEKSVSVVYAKDDPETKTYKINFKNVVSQDQPLKIAVTDADGNPIDLDPAFDPAVGLYNVETSASSVKIFVTGGAAGKTNVVRINNVDTEVGPNGVPVDLSDIQTEDEKSVSVVYAKGDPLTKTYKFNFKKVAQQETESPVTDNKVTVGDSDTSLTFEANANGEMVAKETISLSAAQNSIKMSVAAGSAVQIRNAAGNVIKSITVPADGVITVSKDDFDSGENRIEIISGGKTFVINVKKEAPLTPTLTLSKEGTIGYAIIKVKITGMTNGKVYLVEYAATSGGGEVNSYSVITGDNSGEAVIAISLGNVVTVKEYDSEADLMAGNIPPTATSIPYRAQ